jgi:hypothetical protein
LLGWHDRGDGAGVHCGVFSIPGELLTDPQAAQREAGLVRDHRRDGVAVERTGVKPEHRAGEKSVGQLDDDAVTPRLALARGQLMQAHVVRRKHLVGVDQPIVRREDEPLAGSVAFGAGVVYPPTPVGGNAIQ